MLGSKGAHDFLLATSIVSKILMCTSAAHVPFLPGEFRLAPWSFLLNVLGIHQTLSVWGPPRDASHSIPAMPNSNPGDGFESNLAPSVSWYGCFKRRNILLGYSPLPFLSINQSVRLSKQSTVQREQLTADRLSEQHPMAACPAASSL